MAHQLDPMDLKQIINLHLEYPPDHPILPNSHPRLIFVENNFDEVTRKNVCSGSSLARERNG
ncbi:hypothetical protein, partial [Cryomorpha ignava]|uniref:hypothetical protein n=1 Tax=Cryomorpha ignava TaxID=101383 RepID=UPI001953B106